MTATMWGIRLANGHLLKTARGRADRDYFEGDPVLRVIEDGEKIVALVDGGGPVWKNKIDAKQHLRKGESVVEVRVEVVE